MDHEQLMPAPCPDCVDGITIPDSVAVLPDVKAMLVAGLKAMEAE
jgi:hypothetical protein